MAERVLQFTATIPADTADDITVAMPFDGWDIERIDLEVPAGPAGTLGFYLANNGQPWIPRSVGEYLVWDDRRESFTPTGYPTGSGWQVIGHNIGEYDHSVVVRFHVNPTDTAADRAQQVPYVLTFVEHDVRRPDPVTL